MPTNYDDDWTHPVNSTRLGPESITLDLVEIYQQVQKRKAIADAAPKAQLWVQIEMFDK